MEPRIRTRRVHAPVSTAGAGMVAAALVALALPAGLASALDAAAAPPVASAFPSVIAQRVVTFEEGPHHWSIEQRPLEPAAEPVTWTAAGPEFVVAAHGSLVVTAEEATSLLETGEAIYVAAGTDVTASASGDDGAAVYSIDIVSGDPTGGPTEVGGSFTPGAGAHDVDLLAVVMAAGDTADVTGSPVGPTLAFVTSGSAESNGETLATGEASSVDGDVAFTNTSDGMSVAVAVSIGAAFDGATPPEPDGPGNADGPDGTADGTAPPTTPDETTTTEAPTTTTPVDTDGDDLTDSDEAANGSDPTVPDTDGDGLWDGPEVHQANTDPTSQDTDGDSLSDGREVNQLGSDPVSVDTDGDGLGDGQEVNEVGSNPVKIDTDDDGLTDVQELAFGTGPTNPDSDGDGMSDGFEAKNGGDPTVANG